MTKVVSYYVPRKTSIPEFDKVVVFGIQAFIEDSYTVCDFLDINYTVVNIENAFDELIHQIDVSKITTVEGNEENIPVTKKALTNVPPRIRMTILQSIGFQEIS